MSTPLPTFTERRRGVCPRCAEQLCPQRDKAHRRIVPALSDAALSGFRCFFGNLNSPLLCRPPPRGICCGRIDELLTSIASKKARLDELWPFPPEALARLEHYYDIELTYTSNAIEGNTLSPIETTLVIEKGITVSGKPLKDHLEVLDHFDAIRYVRELARLTAPLTESDLRNLHRLVM